MKTTLTVLIALIIGNYCFSQTQSEMNKQAYAEFNESDKKLNDVYKTILSAYKDDTLFIKNLKKSQRIWVQFRDAEMAMKYPDYPNYSYGSIHPVCRANYLKELTEERIKTLSRWINEVEEDACSGSIKVTAGSSENHTPPHL